MRLVVLHRGYGCDTGCCGHVVEDADTGEQFGMFAFDHPGDEAFIEFAREVIRREMGEDHVKDLDWEHCEISDD